MTRTMPIAVAALLALATQGALAGTANVTWVHPENYLEFPHAQQERDRILQDLAAHVSALARKDLPADQTLTLEVFDVTLAGRLEPTFRGTANEIRVLRGGADWPRMRLRYTLAANGSVLQQGEEQLQDMDYQHHFNAYASDEPLRYEKAMLDDWFKHRILGRR